MTSYWMYKTQLRLDVDDHSGGFDLLLRQFLLHESLYGHDSGLIDSMVKDSVYRMWMQDEPYGVRRYDRAGFMTRETLS